MRSECITCGLDFTNHCCLYTLSIGIGRFRILGGGRRFRRLEGGGGGKFPLGI